MDIVLEKKRGLRAYMGKKGLPYLLTALLVAFVVWAVARDKSQVLRVDSRAVTLGEVSRGEFSDYVRVTGRALPITTVQISPLEGGTVEQIAVEEGARVRKGDVIVVLSNNQLNLSILDSEAQLAEKQNFLRNTLISMEQEKLALRQEKLQLDIDVERRRRAWEQQRELYEAKLAAREDFLQAREEYELATRRRDLVVERQAQDSLYRTVQVEQLEESLENMRRNMTLIRERVANLRVKSPVDGELGLLDVVLGQSVAAGQKLGQVNDLSDYKIEASIDEHYIDRVRAGLDATFDRQSTRYAAAVRKVYPEVRSGQFRADFNFVGPRPDNIRSGQTYYLNLELGQPVDALVVPRGLFYQSTGGSWAYVVSADGGTASRRGIRLGRQNPQYYEVLEGLAPGERIVTSSYDAFGDADVLVLQ